MPNLVLHDPDEVRLPWDDRRARALDCSGTAGAVLSIYAPAGGVDILIEDFERVRTAGKRMEQEASAAVGDAGCGNCAVAGDRDDDGVRNGRS